MTSVQLLRSLWICLIFLRITESASAPVVVRNPRHPFDAAECSAFDGLLRLRNKALLDQEAARKEHPLDRKVASRMVLPAKKKYLPSKSKQSGVK